MLNITPFSTACVKLDSYADYIPGISSITNIINLFLKHVFRPCLGENRLQNNHYFAYLDTKTGLRSVTLMIPVIGNILIAIMDIYAAIQVKKFERLAANEQPEKDKLFYYNQASYYGSLEAMYQLGDRLLKGQELNKDPEEAKRFLRGAAAFGHPQAQLALNGLS